ncbi:MAG: VOC family protein [Acidobacteria bacterium]|uniref:VOC family protein n=1 Tax=Candidatus Polarisedimenticola svalbardensis TaxID=2886004 RepID=A0A8J6Y0W4_9BACT|nr:VOC family protein [Candidatus Polarisedimenticola svalbardensis]
MIKKVAFIGHRVTDMDRAKKFYGEVLGLDKTAEYEGKWCEFDTPEGKTIALDTFSPEGTPPYLSLETDDIEAEVERLKQAGVEVLMDVRDNKVCKMAIIKDSEGNGIMLHQIAPERAK